MKLPVFEHISTYNKFFGEKNLEKWQIFFDYFNDTKLKILDFGCGAGWSIHLGRKLGYDMMGLDVKDMWSFKEFNEFREALDVAKYVKLYSGVSTIPFKDNSFSLIVCRGSFNKFGNTEGVKGERKIILERIGEFSRILKEPRIVVIAGGYFLKHRNDFYDVNLKNCYVWIKNKIKPAWKGK
jgi:SAM-dependent methyltransferase